MITGMICLWFGAIVDIPTGYVICDGNNNTPDLRNKFVIGAGDTHAVGATGGALTHIHTFTGNGHNHSLVAGSMVGGGTGYSASTSSDSVTGSTNPGSSLPPYYSLAYIMKS